MEVPFLNVELELGSVANTAAFKIFFLIFAIFMVGWLISHVMRGAKHAGLAKTPKFAGQSGMSRRLGIKTRPGRRPGEEILVEQGAEQKLDKSLRVTEEHLRVVAEEELILDPGELRERSYHFSCP